MDIGSLQPEVDTGVWWTTLGLRIGLALQSLINEFGICLQFVCHPTAATASYEKDGFIIQGEQRDPSDYSKGILKDAVSFDARMRIRGGIKTGRGWSGYIDVGCDADSDGLLMGVEFGGSNNGPSQPEFDQTNSKVLTSWVASENNSTGHFTAAGIMEGGPAKFYKGMIGNRSAFVDPDEAYVWGVRDDIGDKRIHGLTNGGVIDVKRFRLDLNETSDGNPPAMKPGDFCMWGDGANGVTYLVFFDGGNYLKTPMTVGG